MIPDWTLYPELEARARAVGIQLAYHDITGKLIVADREAVDAILAAIATGEQGGGESLLPPVIVAWNGVLPRLGITSHIEPPKVKLKLESGGTLPNSLGFRPDPLRGDRWYLASASTEPLPLGYHYLALNGDDPEAWTLVISSPERCFEPSRDGFEWGVFAPIYALRGEKDQGIGTLSDAARLLNWIAAKGGSFLSTLPLLPLSLVDPIDPSPYNPISRLFWNELLIDFRKVPEYHPEQVVPFASLSDSPPSFVNYGQFNTWYRDQLQQSLKQLRHNSNSDRLVKFQSFASTNSEAETFAAFRALQHALGRDWRAWGGASLEDADSGEVELQLYAQWLIGEQMTRLLSTGKDKGVELYLDFPLGTHPDGYDVWSRQDIFAHGISVGAPPDPLGPLGQNWGFPPMIPSAMRATRYEYLIKSLQHHMRAAGKLRIDHVMGLHRLFWIPAGMPSSRGVYVRYPSDEIYAIIALESLRNQCVVVGEDLGTVPDEVRAEMEQRNLKRLYVLPFEVDPNRDNPVKSPPHDSVASLNTHDMAPFAAFWSDADISDRIERGFQSPEGGKSETAYRDSQRKIITQLADNVTGGPYEVSLKYLAESDAEAVIVTLEDLWGETEPQNRPGTSEPIPNWRRRAARTLLEIEENEEISTLLHHINNLRKDGGEGMNGEKITRKRAPRQRGEEPTNLTQSEPDFLMTGDDKFLFNEGTHQRLYEKLGSRVCAKDGQTGVHFAVWAPEADLVMVIGDFNGWNRSSHPLFPNAESGIWEGFIPGVTDKCIYKYFIRNRHSGVTCEKADPFANHCETPPKTGSIVWMSKFKWNDDDWMQGRGPKQSLNAPISIYELHLGSWRRKVEDGDRSLTYRELAEQLPDYIDEMGFTHVEFLPVMEHPFYGSWGYQTTGYFAPTSRYGTPEDLKFLIDALHRKGIGVILDWVPSHFPTDGHGLANFDGSNLFEHADIRQGFHPDWQTAVFNYGRNEVRAFLISSAMYWLDQFHIDGLRLDAVASMLYLDYSRGEGEWVPNQFGGRENLEAIAFLKQLSEAVYARYPDVQLMAEESTSWGGVSRPTYDGGLGFGFKWDMGWMHDTLDYLSKDPLYRSHHHDRLTFRMLYAWHENFVLPLSHDEVVHEKSSLLGRMPGDIWQKFANLRLLLATQFTQPGKKLLFMGGELGQWDEWNHVRSLDWHLLDFDHHRGVQKLAADLNAIYRRELALHQRDCEQSGFEWVDCDDRGASVVGFLRWSADWQECVLVVLNYTPVTRYDYRIGVPKSGQWLEILNSDAFEYAGSGQGNLGAVETTGEPANGRPDSLSITLPPLGCVIFKPSH